MTKIHAHLELNHVAYIEESKELPKAQHIQPLRPLCFRTIRATSLGFCRNCPEVLADKMYRACKQKDQSLKRLELDFLQISGVLSSTARNRALVIGFTKLVKATPEA